MRKINVIIKVIVGVLFLCLLSAGVCCMGFASRDENGKWFGNGDLSTWHWGEKTDGDKFGEVDQNEGKELPEGDENEGGADETTAALSVTPLSTVKVLSATSEDNSGISVQFEHSHIEVHSVSEYSIVYTTSVELDALVTTNLFPWLKNNTSSLYWTCRRADDGCLGIFVSEGNAKSLFSSYVDESAYTFSGISMGQLGSSTISADFEKWDSGLYFLEIPVMATYEKVFYINYTAVETPREPVSLPADPVKEGYTFVGWYYDSDFTRPYAGEPIYADTALYAKFEINRYTVTFNSDGGSAVASQKVDWNTAATLSTPTRDKYAFKGWYLPNGTQYTNQPIKADTTLTAHWERNVFTVTFETDGGSAVESQEVNLNALVTLPTTTRTGYVFKGWYLSDGTEYTDQGITADITLTAHWEVQTFTVTFYVDGVVYETVTVDYGTPLVSAMAKANIVSYRAMNMAGVVMSKQTEVTEDMGVGVSELTGWEKYGDWVARNPWYTWLTVGIVGALALIAGAGIAMTVKKR